MPAVAKILLVFAAILVVNKIRVPLGLALLGGGLALNFWALKGLRGTAANLRGALCDIDLWLMLIVVAFIYEFARYLTEKKNADEILNAVKKWGGRHGRVAMMISMPAVIGLVPMPGGALFSAPLVSQAAEGADLSNEWKTAQNFWFRHIWEFWWPLYPGVIIAMSIFELKPWQFISTQLLCTPVAAAVGYFFLVRHHVGRLTVEKQSTGGSWRRAFKVMAPLLAVIIVMLILPELLATIPCIEKRTAKLLALMGGMLVGLGVVALYEGRFRFKGIISSFTNRKSANLLITVAGVLVFQSLLESSGLLPLAKNELHESGIPLVCVVAALPFLAGLVTGLAVGFAGIAFPLVLLLMGVEGSGLTPCATLTLAYGFGFAGMMLSPMHLCLVVTKDYFSASLLKVYRHTIPCALTIMVYFVIAHYVLRYFGW